MKKHWLLALLVFYLILLLAFGCEKAFRYTVGCAEIKSNQSFKFFVASDLHYLSKKSYDNGNAFQEFLDSGDGKLLQYTDELIEALIRDIEAEQPDFLIVTGDLTCNGERESHLELVKKLETIENMGTCVFVVPGNHDIQNPWAKKYIGDETIDGDSITGEEYANLYGSFGYNEAITRDTDSLSYMAMPTEDFWLLMLDSTDYEKNFVKQYPEQGGTLPSQTLRWIEQCSGLAKENKAELLAVMHHSLLNHSEILNKNYTLNNSDELLSVFKKCGIDIVLTGHVHLQDIKTEEYNGKTIYDIATGSLAVFPHQYGRMALIPGKGFDYNTVMTDIGEWSRKSNIADESLKNFEAYSIEFFLQQCGRMHQNCLSKLEELSEKDRDMVLKTVGDMNMLYFAGYRNEALNGIINTEGFRMLENIAPCFTKSYAMSILNDEKTDNNILFIPVTSVEQDCDEEAIETSG